MFSSWSSPPSRPPSPRPTHHINASRSSFANPWPQSWLPTSLLRNPFVRAEPFDRPDIEPTKTVTPDWERYEERLDDGLRFTWLGHAGFLVQFPAVDATSNTVRVVFDPMFSERASPSNWFGPMRWLPPPCTVEDLPAIDFVCISHNHYDHLHLEALLTLNSRSTDDRPITFFVPLSVKILLVTSGIEENRIHELDWWNSMTFPIPIPSHTPTASTHIPTPTTSPSPLSSSKSASPSASSSPDTSSILPSSPPPSRIVFTLTPTQHNSGRGLLDQGATLWGSWVVKQLWPDSSSFEKRMDTEESGVEQKGKEREASVWFAGDTGYQTSDGPCPVFKEIGALHGPFDLAFIPIWRGASLSFIGKLGYRLSDSTSEALITALHASPEDAILVSRDVQARHSVAMHFATFAGSEHEALEPLIRLVEGRERALEREGIDGMGSKGGKGKGRGKDDWEEEWGFGAVDVGGGGVIWVGR